MCIAKRSGCGPLQLGYRPLSAFIMSSTSSPNPSDHGSDDNRDSTTLDTNTHAKNGSIIVTTDVRSDSAGMIRDHFTELLTITNDNVIIILSNDEIGSDSALVSNDQKVNPSSASHSFI
jgi:hypothetical protein